MFKTIFLFSVFNLELIYFFHHGEEYYEILSLILMFHGFRIQIHYLYYITLLYYYY